MTKILVLVGSLRDGFNAALARTAVRQLGGRAGVVEYDRLAELPHFHEGLDADGVDARVDEFRAAVRACDGVLLVTPEYNAGPTSVIKNALDVASRPRHGAVIAGKPVAVIGATPSPGQTVRARQALMEGIAVAGADPVEPSTGIGQAYQHLRPPVYGEEVGAVIAPTLDALVAAVRSRVEAVGDRREGRDERVDVEAFG